MTTSRTFTRRFALTATALATAGLLVACGSDDTHDDHAAAAGQSQPHSPASGSPTSVAPQVNSADVDFAAMMIPHHAQAVEMADLVPTRTQNAWLIEFAAKVKAAQQPEIDQMSQALQSWDQPLPDLTVHHDMDGMMTPEQMTHLASLSGEAFDREWITMMIAHHEGAVSMARTELAQGQNPQMRTLAQQIIDSQQAEITEMREHLD
ncbi:hypothetical protein GOHSU_59_00070 [Gordonia hirsuta DSM 44140 = NBRC 16056]|uniref:DUF305 domain-containing protein n=1 Tax=Gordonia hirsuta DSM 44140 = NBRC 16056 TaxID=1121927 RepID=L7LDC7_9ACTN|nr:DUF305 domain-containing protein [Gordonia hirsuta]GAC58914.1 hypothetical protein GOHSU_59_00070 [Gordonia hirsuta DSM 44140 = NBRC 16056]